MAASQFVFRERARDPIRSGAGTASAERALLRSTYAVVLAGGRGARLKGLTDNCAKPAIPFAGDLKIIDFTLSNCVNSGIQHVGVLTQYKSQSLIRHIMRGWALPDTGSGPGIDVVPAQQQIDEGWYCGTANAVYQNLDLLREAGARYVLVLAGDHVYKMDYGRMIAEHASQEADVTVACIEVPLEQASEFGVMRVDAGGQVVEFEEKPARPLAPPGGNGVVLASMGIYVFSAAFLYAELGRDAADRTSCHDFGRDIIPGLLSRARVVAHDFAASCVGAGDARPYWRDVGTLDAYWKANMDLTRPSPQLDLYQDAWPIRGARQHLPCAKFMLDDERRRGVAIDSLVAGGCIVSGATVRRSVLFSKVHIGDGSLVEDSLVLPDVVVGRNVVLRRAIVDTGCVLPDGIRVGVCASEDAARFTVTGQGVTLVTRAMLARCAQTTGIREVSSRQCAHTRRAARLCLRDPAAGRCVRKSPKAL